MIFVSDPNRTLIKLNHGLIRSKWLGGIKPAWPSANLNRLHGIIPKVKEITLQLKPLNH